MRIAIYYPWIYLTSGVERVILEIVKRSKHEYTIFTNHFDRGNTYKEFKKLNVVELKKISVSRDVKSVAKAAVTIATQKIDLSNFDLLLVQSEGLGDLITLRNNEIPTICYCHTPLRPVFDEYYREKIFAARTLKYRLVFRAFSFIFKLIDRLLWKKYSYVFFNSWETLRRAKNGGLLRGMTKKRYEVLYPGVDTRLNKPSWVYNKYFFLPGRVMWTKNIELAISAFKKFRKENPKSYDFKLIVAGQVDEKSKKYLRKLKLLVGKRKDINFVKSPSDYRMKKLYQNCWAVLLTSFNEDFGITLLEANSFAKPIISVNRGGPNESQKDGITGFLVEPKEEDFVERMAKLAADRNLTLKIGKQGFNNSKKFDIEEFVKKLDKKLDAFV